MAGRQCTAKHVNEKTQFDSINSRIDINLKMGTPGENLLSKSKELMKKAALHRLVGLYTSYHIGSLRNVATALNLVPSAQQFEPTKLAIYRYHCSVWAHGK